MTINPASVTTNARPPMFRAQLAIILACLAALLSNCGSTAATRWALDAHNEDVIVKGATYRVRWINAGGGEYELQSFRNETFHVADRITQKHESDIAVQQVASKLCSGQPDVLTNTEDGNFFYARIRCGPRTGN